MTRSNGGKNPEQITDKAHSISLKSLSRNVGSLTVHFMHIPVAFGGGPATPAGPRRHILPREWAARPAECLELSAERSVDASRRRHVPK